MKAKILVFLHFFFINFLTKNISSNFPLANVLNIFIPFDFETRTLQPMFLFLNLCFCITFLINIQRRLDEHFSLINYTATRIKLKKLKIIISQDLYKNISMLILIYIFTAIIFLDIKNLNDIFIFVVLMSSLFITIIIWAEIFLILKFKNISSKTIYLFLCTGILFSYIFINTNIFLRLMVIGSFELIENPIIHLILKTCIWCTLIIIKLFKLKRIEFIGGNTDD